MNRLSRLALIVLLFAAAPALVLLAQDKTKETPKEEKPAEEAKKADLPEDSLFKLKVKDIDGKDVDLKDYQGKVVLVVNVASKCGLTPQYKGLEKLYTDLKEKGFVILGFPSNDFGGQEPGTAEEIKKFCADNYSVTFPMFEKLQTKAGEGQSEVYKNLQKQSSELPKWNFAKYLVGKDGKVIKFFDSRVKPDDADMRKAIDAAIEAGKEAGKEAAPEEKKPEPKEEKPAGK